MRRFLMAPLLPLALAACPDPTTAGPDMMDAPTPGLSVAGGAAPAGAVYLLSNAVSGNAVILLPRAANGSLGAPASFPTGGTGTGGGLGNQGALALSTSGRFLYAVNPGSDEVSAFRVGDGGLRHLGNVGSGGDQPIALAVHHRLLFVLNDGVGPNVQGFQIRPDGTLRPIPGASRPLSAAVPNAAQVGISPDGRRLVVTEKATNLIVSWDIVGDGQLVNRTLTTSASPTPFGFAFDNRGTLLVSEAVGGAPDASVLSSYRPGATGWLAVSPATATTETAACWVVVTPNGRYAYVTNTGSNTVSGFAVAPDGSLQLLDADGMTGVTGGGPIDAAISRNGRFLYTLDAAANGVSIFRIGEGGSLQHLGSVSGLPAGANGLVAQ